MLKLIPNILTIGRFALSVVFLIMVLYAPAYYDEGEKPFPGFLDVAFILFVITGLTDVIDGPIARKLGVVSKFGRMVDPLADKVLVCGAFICFAVIGQPLLFNWPGSTLAAIHWSVATVIILREVYVTILRHIAEARGVNFAATASGKIKMFLQSFAIGTVLVKMAHVQTATWGYWFTAITFAVMLVATVVSGLTAARRPAWQKATTSTS
jgi:CDP-diacylglycerol--glycerol-3-phosphate 3-phosphatidyltransferase